MTWFLHSLILLLLCLTTLWSADSSLVPVSVVVPGVEYRVTRLQGQVLAVGAAPTLMLDATTHRASGFNGVNRYSGDYTLVGNVLTIGQSLSTMMAGEEAAMKIEQEFMALIAQPLTVNVVAGNIVAQSSNGTMHLVRSLK